MIIVAVSGGIDSMVLLDKLYQLNKKIVIAHVNYQKRADSNKDALVIKKYISDKNIIFEQLLVEKTQYTDENFQAQARHLRYDFFKLIAQKYNTKDVYVAHHKDDFLETYLFKKKRAGLYSYAGIKEISEYQSLLIHRPLLTMYKSDIIEYAKNHNIEYHEDSSNRTLDYERNRIRAKLSILSHEQKELLYQEAMQENIQIEKEEQKVKENLKKIMNVSEFLSFSLNEQQRWLYYQIKKPTITIKHINEIIRKIGDKTNFYETFLDTTLAISYDIIYVLDKMPSKYSYLIENDLDFLKVKNLLFTKYGYKMNDTQEKYPFEVRSIEKEYLNELSMDYKKFRRKLIKDRVPFFIRDFLPVLVKSKRAKELL